MKKMLWLFCFAAMMLPLHMVSAQNLTVHIDPVDQTTEVGQTVSVSVVVDSVTNLGAFQFDIAFNSSVLHASSASVGALLGSTGRTVLPVGPTIDNSTNPGILTIGGATLGVNAGANGSGALAAVEFTAQANGSTSLELQNVQVSDINGQAMAVNSTVNGSVTVGQSSGGSTVVTNTNDSGDGSLRAAITQANSTPEADEITFNIPTTDPGYEAANGIWRIRPATALPTITNEGLCIDGWTQEEFADDPNPEGLEVVIDGSAIQDTASGLVVTADDVCIVGLNIQYFKGAGIKLYGAKDAYVSECMIGTDHLGMARAGNRDGIVLQNGTTEALIGAEEDSSGNIIAGNNRHGIFLSASSYNQFSNNLIGVNLAESDTLGNHEDGIRLQGNATANLIMNNLIGGNYEGIAIINSDSSEIAENWIGTDSSFAKKFGNQLNGIYIWSFSRYSDIYDNVIGHNRQYGISIGGDEALYNRMSENAISSNGDKGIVIWSGGNGELASPVITSYSNLIVTGTAGPGQYIELFSDDDDEGRVFLTSDEADGSGYFSIELDEAPPFDHITATATDADSNTSEFSNPFIYTAVEQADEQRPASFSLSQNFPNPFNPTTTISYQLSATSDVLLAVYNINGQLVQTLIQRQQSAGKYQVDWNGRDEQGQQVGAGIFLCRLRMGNKTFTRRMVLLK